jgi:hypothetical protein
MSRCTDSSSLEELLSTLDHSKGDFLDEVATAIRLYIEGEDENCVAVTERGGRYNVSTGSYEDRIHYPNLDNPIDFCKVLYHFVRSKTYNGHKLESALTDPIVEIVQDKYSEYFESHSGDISEALMKMLVEDKVVLQSFLGMVTDKIAPKLTAYARKKLVHALMHHIQQSLSQSSHHMISQQVTHLTATATGHQVAIVVSHLLLKLVALNLKYLITKLLTTAAAKEIIFVLVKKYVAAAILAAVVHFLAAHLGMATGASIMWVLLPIMVGILARQIYLFPKKLGSNVSQSVKAELSGKFRDVNKTALQTIFDEAFRGDKLVNAIINDKQFVTTVEMLAEKL